MMKTELEYKKNTLVISVEGYADMEEIRRLKQKMYIIMNEYGITELSFNLKNTQNIDIGMFEEFLPQCHIENIDSFKI